MSPELVAAVAKLRAEQPGLGVKKLVTALQAAAPAANIDTKAVRAAMKALAGAA